MASFFFSNDDAAAPAEQSADQTQARPALTSVKCGPTSVDDSFVHSEGTPSGLGHRRAQVVPPSLFSRSRPVWKAWLSGFWCWLWDMDELPRTPAPATGLRKVKSEFNSAMWDLQSMRANQVRSLVEQARSLRELWHLRADVFRVISVHRGQIEAQLRLDALDSHFPVRSSNREEQRHGKVTSW
ncbi:hypothetical protein [Aquabacterium sp. NJ1]|uniref:hypothetical protein n=1 Tax=Aquabacterium sp. NJ1 TaxID=1538295 RepID=UPI000B148127|nr:hypothetical protein [Aquabacterium sp. NJ1]